MSVKLRNVSRLLLALLAVVSSAPGAVFGADTLARETFSVTYTIEIDPAEPARARVRWTMVGIDEIERIRLRFDPERFTGFAGSGVFDERPGEIRWFPSGPYAELRYVVSINHRRAPGKGFDSYAGEGWILSRTTAFFPRSAASFRHDVEPYPESRTRLVLRLPREWQAVTVLPNDGVESYVVETPHKRFDHARGWLLLGHLKRLDALIGGTAVTIARAPGVTHEIDKTLQLLARSLPSLLTLFQRPLPRLVILLGPDPLWRGGLSGEESFYMHGDQPLRSRDQTSPYLHELFHVAAPFRPAPDASWVTEGLAEYYSVELPRRHGSLSEAKYRRALELFGEHGVWGRDFTRDPPPALRNNSAPLVMWALDRRIRAATANAHDLDDVVTALSIDGGAVSTGRFLGTVRRVAGRSFASFFRRYVYRGERPSLPDIGGT